MSDEDLGYRRHLSYLTETNRMEAFAEAMYKKMIQQEWTSERRQSHDLFERFAAVDSRSADMAQLARYKTPIYGLESARRGNMARSFPTINTNKNNGKYCVDGQGDCVIDIKSDYRIRFRRFPGET